MKRQYIYKITHHQIVVEKNHFFWSKVEGKLGYGKEKKNTVRTIMATFSFCVCV